MFLSTRNKLKRAESSGSLFKTMAKEQAGLTVVELLIAVTILVFVLAGAYTFFSFGWRSFDRGTDRAVVQNNLRMATEAITNEVRYAESLFIIDGTTVPDPVVDDDFYIFVNDENRIEKKSATDQTIIPHELDSNLILEVSFVRMSENILQVIVKESGTDMEIQTEVRILNGDIDISYASGNALRVFGTNGNGGDPGTVAVTEVTLNESTRTLQVGEQFILTAQIEPFNATNKTVTWNSSNEDVATVDSNGLVEGISVGTVTITVITDDGGFEATCAVTVVETETLAISQVNPPIAKVDTPYNHTFSATGGVWPYTFSLVSGSLPNGIDFSNDGIITGTPAAGTDGTYLFTVSVTDNNALNDSHSFTLIVEPNDTTPPPPPPEGDSAWVDVNKNGIFEEGTDYELTVDQLEVNPLTIPTGDLVLPEPVGDIISDGVINWDIQNGGLISYINIESTVTGWAQLKIKASGDIIIGPGKNVTARCQQGLKIESTNGKVILNGANLLSTHTGSPGSVEIKASNDILLENADIKSSGQHGLKIESTNGKVILNDANVESTSGNNNATVVIEAYNDILSEQATIKGSGQQGVRVKSINGMIKANGSSTFAYQGGWNCAIIFEAKDDIYIINAQFTNNSTNSPLTYKGEEGHYLYVEGATINTSKVKVINLTTVGYNDSFN